MLFCLVEKSKKIFHEIRKFTIFISWVQGQISLQGMSHFFWKKFILSLLINFNELNGFEMANLIILLVLSIHFYFHTTIWPFADNKLNRMELILLAGSMIIFLSVVTLHDTQIKISLMII